MPTILCEDYAGLIDFYKALRDECVRYLDDQVSYVIETQGENGPQTLSTDYCTCLQEWWEKLMQHS